MKCSKCGNECEENFCPQCGKPADMEENSAEGKTTRNVARNTNTYVTSIAGVMVDVILTVLLLHYKVSVLLIGALWIAVFLDIILEKKNQKVAHRIVTIISTLMVLVAFYEAYNGYQAKKYIDVVQEQEYMDVSYEKLFEHFSKDLEWECTEQERFTSIDTNESTRSGSYEAIVTISGGCYVYNEETTYQLKFNVSKEENRTVATELILDGTSYSGIDEIDRFLNSVYRNYVENNNLLDETDDNSVSQSNTLSEKEQTIASDEDTSLEIDTDVWFVKYNSFYRIKDIGGIEMKTVHGFEQSMQVNLYAPFLLTQILAPKMAENKYGKIVNIATIDVMTTYNAESAEYDASKAGLISLTKTSSLQFAPYVNVNCVCPGWVETDMNKDLPQELLDYQASKTCKGRMAKPEEVAKLVAFLASDDAEFIDGEIIKIDGGYKLM